MSETFLIGFGLGYGALCILVGLFKLLEIAVEQFNRCSDRRLILEALKERESRRKTFN